MTYEAWNVGRLADGARIVAAADSGAVVDEAQSLRGQLGVALDLLRECVGPLEVSAALIESEDGGDAIETLIAQVRKFVNDALH